MDDYPALAMHVDGDWLGTGPPHPPRRQPGHRRSRWRAAARRRGRPGPGARRRGRGFKIWRAHPRRRARPGAEEGGDLLRERAERIARIATMEEGKTLHETRIEMQMAAGCAGVRRRGGQAGLRPGAGPPHRHAAHGAEGAGRAGRRLRPVELPDRQPGPQARPPRSAAGCSVILKPAEEAPASALEVLRALLDAGLPAGVAQVVFGVPGRGLPAPAGLAGDPQAVVHRLHRRSAST